VLVNCLVLRYNVNISTDDEDQTAVAETKFPTSRRSSDTDDSCDGSEGVRPCFSEGANPDASGGGAGGGVTPLLMGAEPSTAATASTAAALSTTAVACGTTTNAIPLTPLTPKLLRLLRRSKMEYKSRLSGEGGAIDRELVPEVVDFRFTSTIQMLGEAGSRGSSCRTIVSTRSSARSSGSTHSDWTPSESSVSTCCGGGGGGGGGEAVVGAAGAARVEGKSSPDWDFPRLSVMRPVPLSALAVPTDPASPPASHDPRGSMDVQPTSSEQMDVVPPEQMDVVPPGRLMAAAGDGGDDGGGGSGVKTDPMQHGAVSHGRSDSYSEAITLQVGGHGHNTITTRNGSDG
jgi:hypothetical protein